MGGEKKTFEKIKNEHIKLHADMNILKEDMKEILTNYHNLLQRITQLEDENSNLRNHNKNLIKFIQGGAQNLNQNSLFQNHQNVNSINNFLPASGLNYKSSASEESYNDKKSSNNNKIYIENSTPISELSAFNTQYNQSSIEMNQNINNNIEKKKPRFLIPKTEN
jgi:hypothetical protein